MTKCGKGCMPECQYFTTCGCISPFNCSYKIETGYINSATSTLHNEVIEDYKHRAEVAERALREFAEETKKLMQRIFGDYIANEMSGFIDEIKEKMERKYGD